jgi:hypothetical protein
MQSELSCHIGMIGKCFCRVCNVRGRSATTSVNPSPSIHKDMNDSQSEYEESDTDQNSASGAEDTTTAEEPHPPKKTEQLSDMMERITRFLEVCLIFTFGITI